MKPIGTHNYFVYITTNKIKSVLYIGVTNNLKKRLFEHLEDAVGKKINFTGKYNCYHLIYYERFENIDHAIKREKQLKEWLRIKKEKLITEFNPSWKFLNNDI